MSDNANEVTLNDCDARLRQLEREIERYRRSTRHRGMLTVGMALVLGIVLLSGASLSSAGDQKVTEELRTNRLIIVDSSGKQRIVAQALADGTAGVVWLDRDGKQRISAYTKPDGTAGLTWADRDEKERIIALTAPNGLANMQWLDSNKKFRISAATLPDGTAGVTWYDQRNVNPRIIAATMKDGSVVLPDHDQR